MPIALITLQDPTQTVDGKNVRKWLRNFLGGYQVPKRIEVVDDLPKTSTGKVRKNVLRDIWNKNLGRGPSR